jgi:hypothetical protein
MPKRSRLAEEKSQVRFLNGKKQNGGHLKTGPIFCLKNDHSKTRRSSMYSVVHCIVLALGSVIDMHWRFKVDSQITESPEFRDLSGGYYDHITHY